MDGVVITGTGAVSPLGTGVPELVKGLLGNEVAVRPAPWASPGTQTAWWTAVPDFRPHDWMDERVEAGTDLFAQFALASAEQAVRQAGLVLGDVRAFDGQAWLERANRLGVTHSQVVPTMLYRVLEVARRSGRAMPAMRRLGYGSAPIPPERVGELIEVFGNVFIQLYGMIEVAAVGTMLRPEDHARALAGEAGLLASVGQPSYGIDVRVSGPSGELADLNGRGEVVFKGPYVMRGYWNEPELTAAAIRDMWMHSGDVAEIRDGWFYLVDRIKDIIIRGGQNIASKEVEEALYHHPAVMEAAVIGVPSTEWGEDIVAVVVLRPGERASAEQIRDAALASGLTRFKCPVRIDFEPELPRNAIGKIRQAGAQVALPGGSYGELTRAHEAHARFVGSFGCHSTRNHGQSGRR
jgi:acyl-CoA synthetase (AMP-forming)/AMP-acid ligase II